MPVLRQAALGCGYCVRFPRSRLSTEVTAIYGLWKNSTRDNHSDDTPLLVVLRIGVGDFCALIVCNPGGGILHVLHQPVEIIARSRNADHADGGAIPQFGVVEF